MNTFNALAIITTKIKEFFTKFHGGTRSGRIQPIMQLCYNKALVEAFGDHDKAHWATTKFIFCTRKRVWHP